MRATMRFVLLSVLASLACARRPKNTAWEHQTRLAAIDSGHFNTTRFNDRPTPKIAKNTRPWHEYEDMAGVRSEAAKPLEKRNGACPDYNHQWIEIPVYFRFYTSKEARTKFSDADYGAYKVQDAQNIVDTLNHDFSEWNPRITFKLVPTNIGNTSQKNGVLLQSFDTIEEWKAQILTGDIDDPVLMNAVNECRGLRENLAPGWAKELWFFSVYGNSITGGDAEGFAVMPRPRYQGDNAEGPRTWPDVIVVNHDQIARHWWESNYDPHLFTHEVGHFLGLEHTFEGDCEGPSNWVTGDFIPDTPVWPENGAPDLCPSYGIPFAYFFQHLHKVCGAHVSSDTIQRGVENFMSYSLPICLKHFTAQQHAKMWQTATQMRGLVPSCGLP